MCRDDRRSQRPARRKHGSAGAAELVGVHAQAEPSVRARSGCALPGRRCAARRRYRKTRELLRGYPRDASHRSPGRRSRRRGHEFFRDLMRAEKGRHDAERRGLRGSAYSAQNLDLVFDRQSVTGLCFDRRRSALEKPLSVLREPMRRSSSSVAARVLRTVERMPPPCAAIS